MTFKEKFKRGEITFLDIVYYVNENYSNTYIYDMYYEVADLFNDEIATLAFIHKFEKTVRRLDFNYYVESNISLEAEYNFDIFHEEVAKNILKLNIDSNIKNEFSDIVKSIEIDVDFNEKNELPCEHCGGTGEVYDDNEEQFDMCGHCEGLGVYEFENVYFMECMNSGDLNDLNARFMEIHKELMRSIIDNYK